MQDLTLGNVPQKLFSFSMPFLLSTIIQAIINLSDLIVVALFSERQGIVAGVGLAGQINYLIINAVIGLCTGGSILISQYFGAKKNEDINITYNTLMTIILMLSIVITVVMLLLATPIINLLKTPQEAFAEARDYLVYTMLGLFFIFIYNGLSAVLRGLGDSIRPLVFIGIAAIINIGLDIVAVVVFDMGAKGVAIATIISQFIGALISGVYLYKKRKMLGLKGFRFKLDKDKIKKVLKIGIPTSIQNIVASLSFIALTYIINITGGDDAVYALTAGSMAFKVNSFAVLPSRSMNLSIAAMVGQNKGAKKNKRIKQTFNSGLLIGLAFGIIFTVLTFVFAADILTLFNADEKTLSFGIPYVQAFSFDYVLLPFVVSQYGLVDGLGKTKVSMWVNSVTSLLLRVPGAFVLGKVLKLGMRGIGIAIPLTSFVSAIAMFIYIRKKIWKRLGSA